MMRDDDFFWEGIDHGKLLAQKCRSCGKMRNPPTPMCAQCQSLEWSPQPLSGFGTVYAWLISKHPTRSDASPRTVILVELVEGLRLVSNLEGGGPAEIGMPVELVFGEVDGAILPQFRATARNG